MSPATPEIDCPQAWTLIDRVCAGGLPGKVAIALRQHLAACPDCKARYREAVEETAALARAVRSRPDPLWRGGRPSHDRRLYRRRRAALLLVVASFLIAMVARLDGDWEFDPTMTFEWVEGQAWVGGALVDGTQREVRVERSDLIRTEAAGRGVLRTRSLELAIGPRAELLVISAVGQRVRLESGSLVVRGDGLLETPRGVIEIEAGEARVTVDASALRVEAWSGVVRRVDARGTRTLPVAEAEPGARAG